MSFICLMIIIDARAARQPITRLLSLTSADRKYTLLPPSPHYYFAVARHRCHEAWPLMRHAAVAVQLRLFTECRPRASASAVDGTIVLIAAPRRRCAHRGHVRRATTMPDCLWIRFAR